MSPEPGISHSGSGVDTGLPTSDSMQGRATRALRAMNTRPRLTLSWRLAASIAVIVTLVMVAVSLPQQFAHQRKMYEDTATWVRALAQPIRIALSSADARDLEASIHVFRESATLVLGHYPDVEVVTGSSVATHGATGALQTGSFVVAETDPSAPSAVQVFVRLEQFQRSKSLAGYWLHVLATIAALSVSLYLTLLYLISRPLEHLLDGVRLMEMGYWGEVSEPSGAWEIRWLTLRFREMGRRLERTVQNLAAAERRGGRAPHGAEPSGGIADSPTSPIAGDSTPSDVDTIRSTLLARLERLETLEADDDGARALAEETLERDPALAEQIGEIDIKTRLEDRAFALLDPDGFVELRRGIAGLAPDLLRQADRAERDLTRCLEAAGVSVVHVQRRIKGMGSVWRKMKKKSLLLSQVHDLLALRVVVGSADECYRALHTVHSEFEPIVGRFKDYIADPKPNGYRSVHTSMRLPSGTVCEVQIRSLQMHHAAERGDSAHWRYRLGGEA